MTSISKIAIVSSDDDFEMVKHPDRENLSPIEKKASSSFIAHVKKEEEENPLLNHKTFSSLKKEDELPSSPCCKAIFKMLNCFK